jgi:hypothetical protein
MRWRRQSEREFMREMIARMERSERRHVDAIDALQATQRDITAEIRQFREESREEHNDQRRALLAILDRLEPGDATA